MCAGKPYSVLGVLLTCSPLLNAGIRVQKLNKAMDELEVLFGFLNTKLGSKILFFSDLRHSINSF